MGFYSTNVNKVGTLWSVLYFYCNWQISAGKKNNNTGVGGNGSHSSGSGRDRDFPPVFSWDWVGKRLIFVGVGRERFENSLPCHPLPETDKKNKLIYRLSVISLSSSRSAICGGVRSPRASCQLTGRVSHKLSLKNSCVDAQTQNTLTCTLIFQLTETPRLNTQDYPFIVTHTWILDKLQK